MFVYDLYFFYWELIFAESLLHFHMWPRWLGLQNTQTASLPGVRPPTNDTNQTDGETTVGRDWKIHRLYLCRRVRPPERVSWYDTKIWWWVSSCLGLQNIQTSSLQRDKTTTTKQSDGMASVMLKFGGMWITSSLPLLPGSLWPGMVTPDRILWMGWIELFDI